MAYIKNPIQAISYSKFRPSPPNELIEKVVDFVKEEIKAPLGCALDVGCGSGQSTEILSPHFNTVIGVDNSQEQLEHAVKNSKHQNVMYRLGPAERLAERDQSVELVTAGMAVHWFNLSQFTAEVGRVLKPNGALALYGYSLPHPSSDGISLADTVKSMFGCTLGQYMPEESRLVYFDGYKDEQFSKFPFSKQPALRFDFMLTQKNANIDDFFGYVSTTSAFQKYMIKHGEAKANNLLAEFKTQLKKQLGTSNSMEEDLINIHFPYVLLLSRKDI